MVHLSDFLNRFNRNEFILMRTKINLIWIGEQVARATKTEAQRTFSSLRFHHNLMIGNLLMHLFLLNIAKHWFHHISILFLFFNLIDIISTRINLDVLPNKLYQIPLTLFISKSVYLNHALQQVTNLRVQRLHMKWSISNLIH